MVERRGRLLTLLKGLWKTEAKASVFKAFSHDPLFHVEKNYRLEIVPLGPPMN